MNPLYAVIDDVYDFTVGKTIAYFANARGHDESPVIHLGSPSGTEAGEVNEENETTAVALPTFRSLSTVIEARKEVAADLSRTVAYVGSARAPLFATPTKEFDTVITMLPYGSMVMVLEEKGRFSKVSDNGIIGWVLRDDLADRAAHVYPEFIVGDANHAGDPNTERLRAVIEDAFHGGEAEMSLQAGEYVLYRLMREGQRINWPPTRPRTPGRWHQILKGAPGVYIGITPKGGSIMEHTLGNDVGHLAYVEAVFPDERITVSEVNNPADGIYNERTMSKEEWQAQNPVFISVS